jgi:dolichol-phosphate mannosyltransferase
MSASSTLSICVLVTHHPRLHGERKYGVWNRLFKSLQDLPANRWMKTRVLGYKIAQELSRAREPA